MNRIFLLTAFGAVLAGQSASSAPIRMVAPVAPVAIAPVTVPEEAGPGVIILPTVIFINAPIKITPPTGVEPPNRSES